MAPVMAWDDRPAVGRPMDHGEAVAHPSIPLLAQLPHTPVPPKKITKRTTSKTTKPKTDGGAVRQGRGHGAGGRGGGHRHPLQVPPLLRRPHDGCVTCAACIPFPRQQPSHQRPYKSNEPPPPPKKKSSNSASSPSPPTTPPCAGPPPPSPYSWGASALCSPTWRGGRRRRPGGGSGA